MFDRRTNRFEPLTTWTPLQRSIIEPDVGDMPNSIIVRELVVLRSPFVIGVTKIEALSPESALCCSCLCGRRGGGRWRRSEGQSQAIRQ